MSGEGSVIGKCRGAMAQKTIVQKVIDTRRQTQRTKKESPNVKPIFVELEQYLKFHSAKAQIEIKRHSSIGNITLALVNKTFTPENVASEKVASELAKEYGLQLSQLEPPQKTPIVTSQPSPDASLPNASHADVDSNDKVLQSRVLEFYRRYREPGFHREVIGPSWNLRKTWETRKQRIVAFFINDGTDQEMAQSIQSEEDEMRSLSDLLAFWDELSTELQLGNLDENLLREKFSKYFSYFAHFFVQFLQFYEREAVRRGKTEPFPWQKSLPTLCAFFRLSSQAKSTVPGRQITTPTAPGDPRRTAVWNLHDEFHSDSFRYKWGIVGDLRRDGETGIQRVIRYFQSNSQDAPREKQLRNGHTPHRCLSQVLAFWDKVATQLDAGELDEILLQEKLGPHYFYVREYFDFFLRKYESLPVHLRQKKEQPWQRSIPRLSDIFGPVSGNSELVRLKVPTKESSCRFIKTSAPIANTYFTGHDTELEAIKSYFEVNFGRAQWLLSREVRGQARRNLHGNLSSDRASSTATTLFVGLAVVAKRFTLIRRFVTAGTSDEWLSN